MIVAICLVLQLATLLWAARFGIVHGRAVPAWSAVALMAFAGANIGMIAARGLA